MTSLYFITIHLFNSEKDFTSIHRRRLRLALILLIMEAQEEFICPVCIRSFKNAIHLRVHSKTHSRNQAIQAIEETKYLAGNNTTGSGHDDNLCIICYDSYPTAILYPCRHSSLCIYCASKLIVCPLCRENIETVGYNNNHQNSGDYVNNYNNGSVNDNVNQSVEIDFDQPPRPPVLSHFSSATEIQRSLEEWKERARLWQERQDAYNKDVLKYSKDLEEYYTNYSSQLENYKEEQTAYLTEWQNSLNDWWENAVLDDGKTGLGAEHYESEVWFRMWDEAHQAYYFYEQYSGATQWEEPNAWTIYVQQHGGESEKPSGLRGVLRIQKYFRRRRQRNVKKK